MRTITTPAPAARPVGELLRDWRRRRRLSQLQLAVEAGISQRHLSFVESGRAAPSRDMLLHLAETLDVPLRARDLLLTAAGFAPLYRERPADDPDLAAAMAAVQAILTGHEPHPALAVDRHWTLRAANRGVEALLAGVADAALLAAPVNVLRLSLHPDGLGRRIVNHRAWKRHVLERLARQVEASADAGLAALRDELAALPEPDGGVTEDDDVPAPAGPFGIAVPLLLDLPGHGRLAFLSTTTVFGTALDVGLAELTVEAFFPADAATAAVMAGLVRDTSAEEFSSAAAPAGPVDLE
ncbi:helix-turn-helix transcriptional regulator [Caenispirillum bisanense]|uniref:Transcriptional regulator, XRE family n=1 Tax=Caenispirillum bisanense TaxID=414052 RepID=A0A286GL06_9PROT|nr:helix-turn-helix transcriptional regulator [Caenispirillum bisanense]SOD95654.1 transcriptional regulator, XRE family [Caenispirillum bisanense]